jgi:starch-binding outer membrane protein, SusD/RagB family
MKKLTYILIVSGFSVLAGCEDFLEIKPQGQLTQEDFPTNQADALLATNAAYSTLRSWNYHSGGFPILDIMSDDAHKGSNPNDGLNTVGPYDNFTHTPTQDGLDRWWASLYQGIKRANVVVEKVPEIEMDNNLKNRYIGEARFLRGLYYFDLVRAWGGVPLVTTTVVPLQLPRASKEEIFDLVEQDLLSAVESLPEKSDYSPNDLGPGFERCSQSFVGKVLSL